MKKLLVVFLALVSVSSFAYTCKENDSISKISNLQIELKSKIDFKDKEHITDTAFAYFSKGKMNLSFPGAILDATYKRQLSLSFEKSALTSNTLEPFHCDVTAYQKQNSLDVLDADLSFYNCPLKAITVNRQFLDLRRDGEISVSSLKYNLGEWFVIKAECN